MPRGGARPGSGPAADPNSLRSMKLAERGGKKILPREYTAEPPEWPLFTSSARTTELWNLLWKKPQAHVWIAQGNELQVGIYVQTFSEAEQPRVPSGVRTLLLQQENALLLTETALTKAGYKIADADQAFEKETASPRRPRAASSRTRLRAVPNVGKTG